jgi:hypothetical protein
LVFVRFLAFLCLSVLFASAVLYLLTRNRRYLGFFWQTLKFSVVVALVVLAFFLLERLLPIL